MMRFPSMRARDQSKVWPVPPCKVAEAVSRRKASGPSSSSRPAEKFDIDAMDPPPAEAVSGAGPMIWAMSSPASAIVAATCSGAVSTKMPAVRIPGGSVSRTAAAVAGETARGLGG